MPPRRSYSGTYLPLSVEGPLCWKTQSTVRRVAMQGPASEVPRSATPSPAARTPAGKGPSNSWGLQPIELGLSQASQRRLGRRVLQRRAEEVGRLLGLVE